MVLFAIVAVYVALFAYYLSATMISQPYWDMFSIITRYLQYQRDGNLWAYLWEPHVQHRHIWMRLLTAFDAEVLSGVGYPFVVVAAACQATAAWLLWRLARRSVLGEPGVWMGCLVLMLVLTSVAAVDCAIPMNGIYPQTVMFTVMALALFDSEEGTGARGRVQWSRGLGLLAAIAAAFGNAAALSLWPILLWLAWRSRAGRTWMAAVVLVGGVFGAAYLYRLPGVAFWESSSPEAPVSVGFLRIADYLVTYVGLPWTRSAALAWVGMGIGALLLVLSVLSCVWLGIVRPAETRLDRVAVSLVAFSLATAVLAALGRSGVDVDLRVPVRYSVFVALMHVGMLLLAMPRVLARCATAPGLRVVHAGVVVAAIVLTAQQSISGQAAVAATQSLRATLARFVAGEETDEMKTVVYVDLAQARRDLDAIHAAGLYLTAR